MREILSVAEDIGYVLSSFAQAAFYLAASWVACAIARYLEWFIS